MMRATVGEYVRCESGVDVASPGVMVDGREVDAVDMGVVVVVFAGAADVCGVEDVVDAAGADDALCSACSAGPGDVVCETEVDGTAILAGVAGVCGEGASGVAEVSGAAAEATPTAPAEPGVGAAAESCAGIGFDPFSDACTSGFDGAEVEEEDTMGASVVAGFVFLSV